MLSYATTDEIQRCNPGEGVDPVELSARPFTGHLRPEIAPIQYSFLFENRCRLTMRWEFGLWQPNGGT